MCDEEVSLLWIHAAFVQPGNKCRHAILSVPASIDDQGFFRPLDNISVGGFERTSRERNLDSIKTWQYFFH
jgi:hypothetical protein